MSVKYPVQQAPHLFCIKKVEVVAYDDLGAEALRRIVVQDFPVTVVNDIYGGDIYEEGRSKYRRT